MLMMAEFHLAALGIVHARSLSLVHTKRADLLLLWTPELAVTRERLLILEMFFLILYSHSQMFLKQYPSCYIAFTDILSRRMLMNHIGLYYGQLFQSFPFCLRETMFCQFGTVLANLKRFVAQLVNKKLCNCWMIKEISCESKSTFI